MQTISQLPRLGLLILVLGLVMVMAFPVSGGGHKAHEKGHSADGMMGTPSPKGAKVYIISPKDGETVTSPVTVTFGLKGMGIAPAGIEKAKTGHHHLLIDTGLPALDEGIPADNNHIHFGGGQTEVTVDLKPGKHTLQLLLADHNHIPHSPPVYSEVVTIKVSDKKAGM